MTQYSDNFPNDSLQEHEETKSLRHEHSLSFFFQCMRLPHLSQSEMIVIAHWPRKNTLGSEVSLDFRAYTLIAESPQSFNL